ncbi:MBL fold metallo-hydrolase [Haloglomus irregulare]|uniref:MBL fold metallo-hydrolase n=1 Tax=Haloglomus irregulare TaxID=2234134 RepID=A0A554MTT4_9EURY|nr:MBL fold metallo-hydrolase [Haloglomus irregulare]TSD08546.1 MBL fold metallo-hydrolase [Haloglomus irregulare]
MSSMEFPETEAEIEPTSPESLKRRIDAGDRVTLLDTRAQSDFEEWHITDDTVTTINVLYFEFLDGIDDELVADIPADEPVVVTCAKGKSSEFVAGLLADAGYNTSHLADGMRGWARLYDHTDVELSTGTLVRQYRRPSSGCLAYMIVNDGAAAVIDPLRAFVERYEADAADLGADVEYVLDTHIHADHISGLRELAAATGATAVLPAAAADRGATYTADVRTVRDGDTLAVGEATLAVLATPGHTSGMTTYRIDEELALTGDTLFIDSVARPDLEEGDAGAQAAAEQLYETLHERLLTLPDETLVGPAHFGETTEPRSDGTYLASLGNLGEQLDLLGLDQDAFVGRVLDDTPPRPANYEEIIATNLGQARADDDEAFTMELGPNNCAAGD